MRHSALLFACCPAWLSVSTAVLPQRPCTAEAVRNKPSQVCHLQAGSLRHYRQHDSFARRMAPAAIGIGAGPGSGERFRHLLVSRSRTGVANRGHSESCWRLTTRSGRCPGLRPTPSSPAVAAWPGAFRYEAAMATGGPNLLQAVTRNAFIAPGMTGCRHRIVDRPDRQARHAADVLEQALP